MDMDTYPLTPVPVLEELPLQDMIELRDRLSNMIALHQEHARIEALLFIRERMLTYGITALDIKEALKKRRARKVK